MYSKEIISELESYQYGKYGGLLEYENNHPNAFLKMPPERQQELLDLIKKYLRPIKTFNHQCDSYGLKHKFEKFISSNYISNGEMKGAMIVSGFKVKVLGSGINHSYYVSVRSLNILRKDVDLYWKEYESKRKPI